jgi:5,5'-dehydrodivanillate O-demethylase
VAASVQLEEGAVKAVRLLGEDLVLFRDRQLRLGLLAEACPHRRASLAYGIPEQAGLRCAYHGWLYDVQGRCLEQPTEPPASTYRTRIQATAYPVRELAGLLFAYLGPEPIPLLPRYNVLTWEDSRREANGSITNCNWLQVMENLFDPLHVQWLHGRYFDYVLQRKGGEQLQEFRARYTPQPMKKIGFDFFEHGIIQRHSFNTDEEPGWKIGTPIFFPTTTLLSFPNKSGSIIFVVPLDDTHTWLVEHTVHPSPRRVAGSGSIPYTDVPATDQAGRFITDTAHGQDKMAVSTQGAITDRTLEHLGSSDLGIIMYRELLWKQAALVADGGESMNVHRIPEKNLHLDPPSTGPVAGMNGHREVVLR